MKIRLSALAVITALTALLSGCYPTGQAPAPIGESESEQSGESHSILPFPDNIILEMDLPKNTPSEVPSVILTLKKWDKEEIKNLFFDGKVITYENEMDEKHMPGEKFNCWDTEDEMVAMRPGQIHYDNKAVLGGEFRYGTVYHYGIQHPKRSHTSNSSIKPPNQAVSSSLSTTRYFLCGSGFSSNL